MNNKSDLTGLTVGNNDSFPFGPSSPIEDVSPTPTSRSIYEDIPSFPSKRLIPSSRIVDPFEQLVARVEKIEQWIEQQKQYQAEQNEQR